MDKKSRSSPLNVIIKQIISNLFDFLVKLQRNEFNIALLASDLEIRKLIGFICSVSVTSVYRVLRERLNSECHELDINELETESDSEEVPRKRKLFNSPKKRGPKSKWKTEIDDNTRHSIREIVYTFHLTEHRNVTIAGLKEKTRDNRHILMEKDDVVRKRVRYLRDIRRHRSENRKMFYMDDTDNGFVKALSSKSKLIILDAGNEEGFVPNARVVFRPEAKKEDYHDHMNYDNYEKWVKEKLLPNLPPRLVVVIDNAPYHNVQVDRIPTSTRKNDIKQWLYEHGIPLENFLLKAELLELVKINKFRFFKYRIDQIFEEAGHNVLRLSPYHPTFNPIENIWGIVKDRVAQRNVEADLIKLMKITHEEF